RKGRVTFDDLQKYVREEVADRVHALFPEQKPDQFPNVKGDFAGKPLVLLTLSVPKTGTTSPATPKASKMRTTDKLAVTQAGQEWDDNSLKMKFCWCPAGRFTMGSPKDEKDRGFNEDQVSVTISRGFWLGKYELTQAEWEKIMGTSLR